MERMFSMKRLFLPYLMILPAVILIAIFKLYPIANNIIQSVMVNSKFSFDAYTMLFGDKVFWNSLWVTVKLNLVMIPLQVFISICIALLVNNTVRGIGVFRTVFYLPVTISMTVSTIVWNMMFNPNSGVINSLLGIFHVPAQGFLIDQKQALWCIVIIATWKGVGYWMMFLLAGLKNIDASVYDAARIDGAGWLAAVLRITLPLIKRTILFVMVANTTTNILLFVPMQMITNGGPQGSTNVLMHEAYKSAFQFADRPRSAAIVTILMFIIVIVCAIQFKLLNETDDADMKG